MALDVHEQEQVDAIKSWWKDNGTFVIGCVLLFVVVIGGWQGWKQYQYKMSHEAVTLFQSFLEQIDSKDAKRVNTAAQEVIDRYSSTPYASYAALFAAQFNMQEAKDSVKAKQQLQWVINQGYEDGMKAVAGLRLATILLDEGKYDDALKQLNVKHDAAYDVVFSDLKGDILTAQGKNKEALSEYKLAFAKTEEQSFYRNFIQMKMDDLGVVQ